MRRVSWTWEDGSVTSREHLKPLWRNVFLISAVHRYDFISDMVCVLAAFLRRQEQSYLCGSFGGRSEMFANDDSNEMWILLREGTAYAIVYLIRLLVLMRVLGH
jgi:hypothetical protein